jgi:capsular polysaccharide biosynthesis protein
MNLKTTLIALRSGWQLIAIGLVVALGAAFALDRAATPVYEATATYVVSPGFDVDADDVTEGVKTLDSSRSRSIMTTLTEITMSETVLDEAFATLGLDPSTASMYVVDSIVVPEANVIQTTVAGPEPEIAAALTTLVGDVGGLRFVGLYQIYDIVVLDPATVPTTPSNPGLPILIVLTSVLGLAAGAGAAMLRFAWGGERRTVGSRLKAYDPTVTPIEEHSRFKRVG